MSNDGKRLYLVFYDDPSILPLPIWLSSSDFANCKANCTKARKFVCLGYFSNGEFVSSTEE